MLVDIPEITSDFSGPEGLFKHFDGQYTDSEYAFIDLLRIMIGWRNVPCDHHYVIMNRDVDVVMNVDMDVDWTWTQT